MLGRSFELKAVRQTWGEDRVFFYEEGRLRGMPATWTDAVLPPAFVVLAAGRAHFRPEDLLRLAELVDGVRTLKAHGAPVARAEAQSGKSVLSELRQNRKPKNAGSLRKERGPRAVRAEISAINDQHKLQKSKDRKAKKS